MGDDGHGHGAEWAVLIMIGALAAALALAVVRPDTGADQAGLIYPNSKRSLILLPQPKD